MTLIKHKKGGVLVGPNKVLFPKGEAVEIADEELAKRILRNPDFSEVSAEAKEKKGGKGK